MSSHFMVLWFYAVRITAMAMISHMTATMMWGILWVFVLVV